MTTATRTGIYIFTPRAVVDFFDACEDSNEQKLFWHFLHARNPYERCEPSFEQVARDFDRWLRQRPTVRKQQRKAARA